MTTYQEYVYCNDERQKNCTGVSTWKICSHGHDLSTVFGNSGRRGSASTGIGLRSHPGSGNCKIRRGALANKVIHISRLPNVSASLFFHLSCRGCAYRLIVGEYCVRVYDVDGEDSFSFFFFFFLLGTVPLFEQSTCACTLLKQRMTQQSAQSYFLSQLTSPRQKIL